MPAPLPRPRWPEGSAARVRHAVLVCLALLVVQRLSWYVFVPLLGRAGGALTFLVGNLAVIAVILVRHGRVRARDLGYTRAGWRREALLGVAGFVAISAVLLGWIALVDGAAEAGAMLATITSYSAMQRVSFLVIGLAASLVEETVFRGYLQPALIGRYGATIGLFVTMAAFQVGHYTDWPTLGRIGGLAIVGLGLGVLRWQHRPLTAAFVAHTLIWLVWGNA